MIRKFWPIQAVSCFMLLTLTASLALSDSLLKPADNAPKGTTTKVELPGRVQLHVKLLEWAGSSNSEPRKNKRPRLNEKQGLVAKAILLAPLNDVEGKTILPENSTVYLQVDGIKGKPLLRPGKVYLSVLPIKLDGREIIISTTFQEAVTPAKVRYLATHDKESKETFVKGKMIPQGDPSPLEQKVISFASKFKPFPLVGEATGATLELTAYVVRIFVGKANVELPKESEITFLVDDAKVKETESAPSAKNTETRSQ